MADDNDSEYFLKRVVEELESEGHDLKYLANKAWEEIKRIATRIAMRLKTTVEKVLDALEQIANMFG